MKQFEQISNSQNSNKIQNLNNEPKQIFKIGQNSDTFDQKRKSNMLAKESSPRRRNLFCGHKNLSLFRMELNHKKTSLLI